MVERGQPGDDLVCILRERVPEHGGCNGQALLDHRGRQPTV